MLSFMQTWGDNRVTKTKGCVATTVSARARGKVELPEVQLEPAPAFWFPWRSFIIITIPA